MIPKRSLRSLRSLLVLRAALLCGVLSFALPVFADATPDKAPDATAAAPAVAPSAVVWMPTQLGSTKSYVHRSDRTLSSAGTQLSQERLVGSREEQVLPAPAEFAKASAEVRVVTRMRGAQSGEEVETHQMYVSATPSAYEVHAAKVDANGAAFLIRYPSPAVALKEGAKPGEKWHVSTEDVGGLAADTWGEVIGLQDARTPAGLFEKCLVVRYTGTVSGTLEVPGAGKMDVTSGKVVVTEWHAQGVGMVLSKEEIVETLVAPNGVEVEIASESQTSLRSWTHGGATPASPAR